MQYMFHFVHVNCASDVRGPALLIICRAKIDEL